MNIDNKPSGTDSTEEDLGIFDEEQSTSGEGQKDVVDSETTVQNLTLAELNELAGRKDNPFKSKEEFVKHYGNLKSFAGQVNQKEEKRTAPQLPEVSAEIAEIKARIEQRDFLDENPTAKAHLDLIKSVAQGDQITLSKAWEKVKEVVEGAEAHKKELEIGVKSKNRINPVPSQELQELADKIRGGGGSERERQELVSKWLGLK